MATDNSYTISEDASASGNVLTDGVADSDIDSASLTAVLAGNPAHGTVLLNSDGSFTYTPYANYNGADSFTYYAKDNFNAMSNMATVTITLNPTNDAPVANPDTYLIAQNSILNIPAPGVLANDGDIENNTLNAILVADAAHGDVVLNPNGYGSFTYTPDSNYFGPDSFTYKANDGLDSNVVTVSIQVDVPVPSMLSVSAITATTVLLTGNSNTQTASERGFFWWTDYASSGLMSSGSAGMGNFSMTPTGLKPNTTYNVSAYIKVGTQVITSANKLTFTTTDPIPPSVITGSLFSVIGQDITATGEIINIGSTPVTIYGFVYNTSPYPTVWDKALPFTWDTSLPLSAGKTFSGTIRNLPAGKYYLRAYAHNSFGTSYGEQIEFDIVGDVVSSSPLPGDVNGDSAVDLEDAIIVLHILSGISVNVQIHPEADVNGDKRIGLEELAYVLQKASGIR
ncbi:MAG: tandem-95 repeat protein [Desulfobacteraceae bacterium]|nr:tandem-95 repeat protein [Desulfobacteraceae bacterium]